MESTNFALFSSRTQEQKNRYTQKNLYTIALSQSKLYFFLYIAINSSQIIILFTDAGLSNHVTSEPALLKNFISNICLKFSIVVPIKYYCL